MGLKSGDSLSSWIACAEAPESYILHLACYKAGIKILALSSDSDLDLALSSTSALVFSPWEDCNGAPQIDAILQKVPSMLETPAGSLVISKHATKYFIQSGYKTIRGTYKLKSLPVYSPLADSVSSLSYTYKNQTINNDDFNKFSTEFSEKIAKEGDVIVNTVACKSAFGFASVLASIQAGAKSVSSVLSDAGEVSRNQNAKILIITEDKIKQIGEGHSFEKIVLGVEKKEDVDRVIKILESKGVTSRKTFPYQVGSLSSLV